MTSAVKRVKPCPPGFSDHVYKEAHGVKIPLRIWPAPKAFKKAPWLVWIHGGGLIAGKHAIPNAWVLPACKLYGYHVISIAYRFLPHVQMPDILADCLDSVSWCRDNLEHILGPECVDIDSYVVAGDSAGGQLSTLCGHFLDPKPSAVIDVFGIIDPTDPVYHIKTGQNPWGAYNEPRDEAEMQKHLSRRDPAKAEYICPWDWELEMPLEDLRSFWGVPEYITTPSHSYTMDLNRFLSNEGTRMALLFQRELFDTEDDFQEHMKKYSSIRLLKDGAPYPPTFILHGQKDRMVAVEQSYRFEARLKELGVPVGSAYSPDGDHSFENVIQGPDDAGWEEYIVPCMEFTDRYIRRCSGPGADHGNGNGFQNGRPNSSDSARAQVKI